METNEKNIKTLVELSKANGRRLETISKEFKNGFEFIRNYPKSVTFFGSARTKENDFYYNKARVIAERIVKELHYSILTGGGPGIMGAGNRGAFEAGGNSLGLNIKLPHEQESNKYLTDSIDFHYFFSRKVCLSYSAEAYVFFPGGFGTLDEFLEILTLVQTHKIPKTPIILVGNDYWKPIDNFFKTTLLESEFINNDDLDLYTITEDEDLILDIISKSPIRIGLEFNENKRKVDAETTINGPISDLASKHCIPCEGNVKPLSRNEGNELLKNIDNGWKLENDELISKNFVFENFDEAMNFINQVAEIAENEGHHPDIKLHNYKEVLITIQTHTISGLTENDFILASKINEIK